MWTWNSHETGRASATPRTGTWCSQDAPQPCFQLTRGRVMLANWLPWRQGLQQLQAHTVQALSRDRKRLDSRFKNPWKHQVVVLSDCISSEAKDKTDQV